MITFGKTSSQPNFLFKKLPHYFKENDSYKDGNNEGLLERYLGIFCNEIDDELSLYIDELLNITDAEALLGLTKTDGIDLLIHIAETFGNPLDIGIGQPYSGDQDEYIVLIRHIIHILQTKGTEQGLIYYLAIYGYEITTLTNSSTDINSYDEKPTPIKYDVPIKYDTGFSFYSSFSLVITDLSGTTTKSPPQSWLDNYLKVAIQNLLTPIWAVLDTITYSP